MSEIESKQKISDSKRAKEFPNLIEEELSIIGILQDCGGSMTISDFGITYQGATIDEIELDEGTSDDEVSIRYFAGDKELNPSDKIRIKICNAVTNEFEY